MAALITNLFLFLHCLVVPILAQNLLSCNGSSSQDIKSGYISCTKNATENQCTSFAVLHTNPYYSSLFNLSFYLGLDPFKISEANGLSSNTQHLSIDQPILIPIDCKCSSAGFFEAELVKTTAAGETIDGVVESLEGLTTCRGIREKNPEMISSKLPEKIKFLVPLRCACPSSSQESSGTKLLVSYPVSSGDSLTSVAQQFNVSYEAIIKANNLSEKETILNNNPLSILIPLSHKPLLRFPKRSHKKKLRMWKLTVCITFVSVAVAAVVVALFFVYQWKRKKREINLTAKMTDVELQQLNMSIRTTSEKKVSFEGSQTTLDGQGQGQEPNTPRAKMMVQSYSIEELNKATEDFNSHNLIEGSVYQGRLKGKNLAIKCTTSDFISMVDLTLFQDSIHNHPNILRVLGSCLTETQDSYLVFEYAQNGSLKDWIHQGGLAMKSHFIASCCCFLSWSQRVKICLDVALALQYMHHIMHPAYVHQNIKSRNIFLDEEFNAKVGNFGMPNDPTIKEGDSNTNTEFSSRNPASWNRGYLAPEYLKQGTISPSMDVFAYGVVLLEIVSGKTPVMWSDEKEEREMVMLSETIKSVLESEEELRAWIQSDLGDNYSFEAAVAVANLARACVDDEPSLRPSAGEIVQKLSRFVEDTPEDQDQDQNQNQNQQFFINNESCSKPLVQAAATNNS